jgi:IS30 family transposase
MQITQSKHYQQIQLEVRMTLTSPHFHKFTVRKIVRTLGRSPSSVSRELSRNCIGGHYASKITDVCFANRPIQDRHAPKLHKESIPFGIAHNFLYIRWSPEQISMTLSATYPRAHEQHLSRETFYNYFYTQPVGELKRVPRSKGQDCGSQSSDMVSIHVRPPVIEDCQFPSHWEGDLIKDESNGRAGGTLVDRTTRSLMLIQLPEVKPASALNLLQGFTDKLLGIVLPLRLSMTYGQGREMEMHMDLSKRTGIPVYICYPHSPWQRGSNENIGGFLPMGTDLSVYSQEELDAVADEINRRPRKGLEV